MRRDSKGSMFTVGALNGLLPCGLVYFALAGAIASGSILYGAVYMALFGIGTIPMMLATSLVGPMLGYSLSRFLRPLTPVVIVTVGCLFILRGLNLGIPYVSPKVSHSATTAETGSCCQVK